MLKRMLVFLVLVLCSGMPQAADELVRSGYPLLDNRFRVDHGLDEITLVIYRQLGSSPAIVIRPDGSKLYVHTTPPNVSWIDEPSFDIITIAAPMPGPWQIIGSIDKKNQIKILSDLQLEVEPFPPTFYRGERLKIRSHLMNYGDKLNIDVFRYNTELRLFMHRRGIRLATMDAITSGNELGQFYDDGTGLDEFPGDGDFTSEVTTNVLPGRYQFFIMAQNKTFTRMQVQEVKVLPMPLHVDIAKDDGNPASITLRADDKAIKPESVAMTLNLVGANKFSRHYEIKSLGDNGETTIDLAFIDRTGDYRLQGWLFATTQKGREIALEIDPIMLGIIREASFSQPSPAEADKQQASVPASAVEKTPDDDAQVNEEEGGSLLWLWVALAVLAIVGVLGAVWWFVIRPKRAEQKTEEEQPEGEVDLNKPEG